MAIMRGLHTTLLAAAKTLFNKIRKTDNRQIINEDSYIQQIEINETEACTVVIPSKKEEATSEQNYECVSDTNHYAQEPIQQVLSVDLKAGDFVFHNTFGKGTVTDVSHGYITVQFKNTITEKMAVFNYPSCMGTFVFREETDTLKEKETLFTNEFGQKEYEEEKHHFEQIKSELSKQYQHYLTLPYDDEHAYDTNGIRMIPGTYSYDHWKKQVYTNRKLLQQYENLCNSLYFARVRCNSGSWYIGKYQYKNHIIDWRDPRNSLYYQYQMYIGNPQYGLSLVRDFDINAGAFYGFIDKYSRSVYGHTTGDKEYNNANYSNEKINDGRLLQILAYQRQNKETHDIIASIQANQYRIITSSSESTLVVEGCAGSGKTMILLHRISYLLRNNPMLHPERIAILSPTEMLSNESGSLSEDLQLQKVQRFSNIGFYKRVYSRIANANGILWTNRPTNRIIPNFNIEGVILKEIYSEEFLNTIINDITEIYNNDKKRYAFVEAETKYLNGIEKRIREKERKMQSPDDIKRVNGAVQKSRHYLEKFSEEPNQDHGYLCGIIESRFRAIKERYALSNQAHYEWEEYLKAHLLLKIVGIKNANIEFELVAIDELQDYSLCELRLIKAIVNGGRINYYGDFTQCISPKAVSRSDFLLSFGFQNPEMFTVNENYRNAYEITAYVNDSIGLDMLPIGIHGQVKEIKKAEIPSILIHPQDRVAVIVQDESELYAVSLPKSTNYIQASDATVSRGELNVIPVSLVKGLEFETAIVIPNKMTRNEKYVAMTRALDTLYIVTDAENFAFDNLRNRQIMECTHESHMC